MKNQLLKEYIQRQVRSLLKEAVTDEVYHFTSLSNIINILKNDVFYLSFDYDINKFGLSLSRTKSTKTGFLTVDTVINNESFSYDKDYIVRLKLDGRKLSQTYKGQPYNYFKHMIKHNSHEYEDRLLSNKERIEDFSKYIIQIDIKQVNNYYQQEEGDVQEIIDELQNLCDMRNIHLNIVNPNKIDKNYLEENKTNKSLLKEEVYGNKAICYHRTSLNIEQLNDIFFNKKWTFGSNAGSMYGAGLYTTYSLESQMKNNMISSYGKNIIKFSVNLKNFLICDYKEFQKTPQYQRLNKPKEQDENGNLIFIIEQLKDKNIIIKDLYSKNEDYTSDTILYLLDKFPKIKILFDGIMYTGSHDGKCCVVFFQSVYDTSIPLGYYAPKNDSPRSINDYQYISSFNDNNNFKNVVNDKLNKNYLSKDKYLNLIITRDIHLSDVPEKYRTKKICEIAVSINGLVLQFVPEKYMTKEICEIAVSNYGDALQFVPEKLEDYHLCNIAVYQDYRNLKYIKNNSIYFSICKDIINNDDDDDRSIRNSKLKFILSKENIPIYQYYYLCKNILDKYNRCLMYISEDIPKKYYYSLCKKAVSKDGWNLDDVPMELRTYEVCYLACSSYYKWSIMSVPEDIENYYSLVKISYPKNKEIVSAEFKGKYVTWSLPKKYIPQLINDFPEDKEFLEKYLLKEFIQTQVKTLLKEAVTDEVYHFTFLSNIINILQSNQFQFGLNNDPDDTNTDETNLKYKYYMSVSRTKTPKVGFLSFEDDIRQLQMEDYDLDFMVRLKLDGRLLSQNYKGVPFNYTKHVYLKDKSHEYEDRILSNKPTIENFSKYITQIDIKQVHNYYAEEEGEEALNEIIDELQNLCNQRNIKLNIVNPNKIDKNYLQEETKSIKQLSQEQINSNLQKIITKYSNTSFNSDNYSIGGGLSSDKYVSRRQEDAKNDSGKLTLGQATQLFKKATGQSSEIIKLLIQNHFPNLEWHHAGFIPGKKSMNKTYFLNSKEITELATKWNEIFNKQNKKLPTKENKLSIENYLKEKATPFERITKDKLPQFHYITKQEMNGKYGWFKAQDKYNMTIYYTGYSFNNQKEYNLFKNNFNI